MGWSVKNQRSDEIDLDGSCLLFDKYGFYVDSIFWDNLNYENSIKHTGDKQLDVSEEYEDEVAPTNETEDENIVIKLKKLENVYTILFFISIFTNQKFVRLESLSLHVKNIKGVEGLCYSTINTKSLLSCDDNNALLLCKLCKASQEADSDWIIQIMHQQFSIPPGSVVDFLILAPDVQKHVLPYIQSWDYIEMNVMKGMNLSIKDLYNSKSDPYVKVSCGIQDPFKGKSKTKKRTLNPIWEEGQAIFNFEYGEDRSTIHIECYDRDWFGEDDFIGFVDVEVSKIPCNTEYIRWFTLEGKGRKEGQATGILQIKFEKRFGGYEATH